MRKRLRIVCGLALAGVLALPVAVLGVHVAHPRDEDGYLAHLKQYGDRQTDQPLRVLPPTADLVAEGDAACDWLREQPYALWRHDARYGELAVYERYLDEVGDRPPTWGAALPDLRSVTGGAWTYLCPADRELREPRRNPFAPKPD
ncbi:hypothetical protein ACIA5A_13635 [Micromonospora sp. NPDC051300]|uniref:hypothetical protein n=1 Tax=Micromonospora sp. NPDC051300 TaxID=3364286 RepID=UPI003799B0B1